LENSSFEGDESIKKTKKHCCSEANKSTFWYFLVPTAEAEKMALGWQKLELGKRETNMWYLKAQAPVPLVTCYR
jgi:hypothetical protein